ncbi:hypothetical protein KUTeg_018753 [Tegillarca granosa]|uniref:Uncharacterized protein n=1 Tax=Tegillarca granosa TaxID=220873 RepID=A0ABQ9EJW3_TEGGR|nr:hypothetical protein KUTeg_018753 [Tegillarca granosa]
MGLIFPSWLMILNVISFSILFLIGSHIMSFEYTNDEEEEAISVLKTKTFRFENPGVLPNILSQKVFMQPVSGICLKKLDLIAQTTRLLLNPLWTNQLSNLMLKVKLTKNENAVTVKLQLLASY